jgi:hypothetical protein
MCQVLYGRQTFAPDAAPIAQNPLAAFARVPAEKSVLPFAAHFRRLILSFHKISSISPLREFASNGRLTLQDWSAKE